MVFDERTVGHTVMLMAPRLDAGPIIEQGTRAFSPTDSLHAVIECNTQNSRAVTRRAVDRLLSGAIAPRPQGASCVYYTWPTSKWTRRFRKKGKRYITVREAVGYVLK